MNKLDIFILIFVALPTFFGFKKGLLKSVFSLIGLIAGLFLATKFHHLLSFSVSRLFHDDKTAAIVSFLVILIVVYGISIYIAGRISEISRFTKTVDRVAGLFFGFAKGLLIASLFVMITKYLGTFNDKTISDSKFYVFVYDVAPRTFNALSSVIPVSKKTFDELNPLAPRDTSSYKK